MATVGTTSSQWSRMVLVRRFPIYKDGDSDAKPTGGTRQFQYKLTPGEAGWILRLDKTVDY